MVQLYAVLVVVVAVVVVVVCCCCSVELIRTDDFVVELYNILVVR